MPLAAFVNDGSQSAAAARTVPELLAARLADAGRERAALPIPPLVRRARSASPKDTDSPAATRAAIREE